MSSNFIYNKYRISFVFEASMVQDVPDDHWTLWRQKKSFLRVDGKAFLGANKIIMCENVTRNSGNMISTC